MPLSFGTLSCLARFPQLRHPSSLLGARYFPTLPFHQTLFHYDHQSQAYMDLSWIPSTWAGLCFKFVPTALQMIELLRHKLCWLRSLWQFTNFAGICLTPESPVIPPAPHIGDSAIMDCVLLTVFPCNLILAINHCQIAHCTIYWLDVATGWGDGVSPCFLQTSNCQSLGPGSGLLNLPPNWSGWYGQLSYMTPCIPLISNSWYPLALGLCQPIIWILCHLIWSLLPSWSKVMTNAGGCFTLTLPGHIVFMHLCTAGISVLAPPSSHMACIKNSSASKVQLSSHAPVLLSMAPTSPSWPLCTAHLTQISPSLIQAILASSTIAIFNGSYMPQQYQHLTTSVWILHSGSASGSTCHGVS